MLLVKKCRDFSTKAPLIFRYYLNYLSAINGRIFQMICLDKWYHVKISSLAQCEAYDKTYIKIQQLIVEFLRIKLALGKFTFDVFGA